MSDMSWRDELRGLVLTEQIVVGALIAGATIFFAVAAFLVTQDAFGTVEDAAFTWVMNVVLLSFLAVEAIAWVIVPRMMVAAVRRKILAGQWTVPDGPYQAQMAELIERTGDAGRLMGAHSTKTIVSAAMIEGATFFAIIVFMVAQSTVGLAVAVVLILLQALLFPTRNRVFNWIANQLRLIEQERSFGNP